MLFLTNEQANMAEITILSARDATRPGFQTGASWVAVYGYISKGITRECHLGLRTNSLLYFVCFSFQFDRIGRSIFSLL